MADSEPKGETKSAAKSETKSDSGSDSASSDSKSSESDSKSSDGGGFVRGERQKVVTKTYRDNWDHIFRKSKPKAKR